MKVCAEIFIFYHQGPDLEYGQLSGPVILAGAYVRTSGKHGIDPAYCTPAKYAWR
jgi:hypothetical protein